MNHHVTHGKSCICHSCQPLIVNADDAELLAEALESLTDEQFPVRIGTTDLVVAAAQIAGERRFLR